MTSTAEKTPYTDVSERLDAAFKALKTLYTHNSAGGPCTGNKGQCQCVENAKKVLKEST